MEFRLDMSMMFAMHDALRRELGQVGRIAKLRDDDPAGLLRAALGWELFKKFLLVHHRSEDDALWPALRGRVAQQPGRVALVDALEAEHARHRAAADRRRRGGGRSSLRLPAARRHR